jgi:pimeloyl-ACP methyl ester carboxylesterase
VAPDPLWGTRKFVVFERSGHFPFYEEPEEFVRVIEDFLAR